MSRERPGLALCGALLLGIGCSGSDVPRTGNGQSSSGAASAAAAPAAADRAGDGRAVCLEADGYVASGDVPIERSGTDPGEAERISALRWQSHDGCERFVIDLVAADGSPPRTAGEVRARVMRDLGVVRVSLVDVPQVNPDATDAAFAGPLARAAYSVWSNEGRWTYVDLHMASAAEVHVATLADPARVVVDLRPGGGPLPARPAAAARVVVLRPRAGEAEYPLQVTGYARTFESNVVVRLTQRGEQVHESFTTATAWVDAWGHYLLTVPDGPTGPVRLHVGEYSARDGSWEGVAIDLTMR